MLSNFVHEWVSAPGSATTLNLNGARDGRTTFLSRFGNGGLAFYFIDNGSIWEAGHGVVSSGSPHTLTRATVLRNSSGGTARLTFTGDCEVYNEVPAERAAWINNSGYLNLNPYQASGATWLGTTGGTSTAFTVAQPVTGNTNTEGMLVCIRFHTKPGDQPTLAVGGATARGIYQVRAGAVERMRSGDGVSGQIVELRYDSGLPGWVILGPQDASGWKILDGQNPSSATSVDFTLPAAYRRFRLEWIQLIPAANSFPLLRVSTDGSNYDSASADYEFRGAHGNGTAWTHITDGGTGTSCALGPQYQTSQPCFGWVEFQSTGMKWVTAMSAGLISSVPQHYTGSGRHVKNSTTLTNARFLFSGGNINSGQIRLLGGSHGFGLSY